MDKVQQTYLNSLLIQKIQKYLLKKFKKKNWNQFITSQKYGDCQKIASIVANLDQNIQVYEAQQNFSQRAVDKLKEMGDDGDMFGNHYINKINGQYYDFGKGTNCISGVYLVGDNENLFNVELSQDELKHFYDFKERSPIYFK